MPVEITMPQLSDTMTEGTVVKWLKKEGDKVKSGDIIAEIETDKANMEMESFDAGTLAVLAAKEGDKVKVGQAIAVLATGGENPKEVKSQYATPSTTPSALKPSATKASQPELASATTTTAVAPRAGNGESGRVRISPLARRLAEERGVDIEQSEGSGPGGRITQRDVLASVEGAAPPAPVKAPAPSQKARGSPSVGFAPRVASGQREVVPLTKIRATIAQRLQQSKQQVPHFYTTVEIDVEEIALMRPRLNKQLETEEVKLSLGDFVAKAVAQALLLHPQLNAHFINHEIIRFGDAHLGMAVALPEGLIVPVLRYINQMGLREIRERSEDLVDRARAGKLNQDEMTGATFTVSNLGMYGVREFSAIINPPEVAILAVSAAEKRPVVRDGQIVPRIVMAVTLSADHRAVDGATAAEFLRTLKKLLEEPGMMLV